MAAADPAVRRTAAAIAAHSKWAKTSAVDGTKSARRGFLAKFEREVDPDGILSPAERDRRARNALKAYMGQLSLRSRTVRAT